MAALQNMCQTFNLVKLGFTGVYIIFLIFALKNCGYLLKQPHWGSSYMYVPETYFYLEILDFMIVLQPTISGMYLFILLVQKIACILLNSGNSLFRIMTLTSGKNSMYPRLPTVLMARMMSSGLGDFIKFITDCKYCIFEKALIRVL